jgi:prephenate dehydratase
MTRVVYQGARGCFSELAARRFFGEGIQSKGMKSFEDVFEAIRKDKILIGTLPIENSLSGSIHRNYDLLLAGGYWVIGEIKLKITYNLFVNPGTRPHMIREIWSHPVALDQCRTFFKTNLQFRPIAVYDSAGAAQLLKEKRKKNAAVIAGPQVEKIYGLQVIEKSIEDNPENYTRFLLISRRRNIYMGVNAKTTVVFGVQNEPGILFRCLSIFALRNIDLTKLESRPHIGRPWEYLFYIDFKGSMKEEHCQRALEDLKENVSFVKFMGSYEVREEA